MNFIGGYEETNLFVPIPNPPTVSHPQLHLYGYLVLLATNLEIFQMKSFILKNKK